MLLCVLLFLLFFLHIYGAPNLYLLIALSLQLNMLLFIFFVFLFF